MCVLTPKMSPKSFWQKRFGSSCLLSVCFFFFIQDLTLFLYIFFLGFPPLWYVDGVLKLWCTFSSLQFVCQGIMEMKNQLVLYLRGGFTFVLQCGEELFSLFPRGLALLALKIGEKTSLIRED